MRTRYMLIPEKNVKSIFFIQNEKKPTDNCWFYNNLVGICHYSHSTVAT